MIQILGIAFFIWAQQGELISKTVAQVGDQVLTSRQVEINQLLEEKLNPGFQKSSVDKQLNDVMLETVVALEAENFSVAPVTNEEIEKAYQEVSLELLKKPQWKKLEVQDFELRAIISLKLRSKKFLKFKADSMTVITSEEEAKSYYDKNRVKFGTTSFAELKDQIRSYLKKEKQEEKMKQWFELLKAKYRIRKING